MNPSVVSYTLREPVGVVGAIIPWNYPLMMAAWKVAPALATGNTLILKPASATPLSAIRLGELALEAGIPAGVLNVVPGPGAEVGEAMAVHPGIDKIAFTGETATGRRIAEAAAKTLKRVSLELGGKSPNIVFADADLDAAVIGSLWAIYYSAGQSCEARSRLLVQDEVYDAFASAFAEKAKALTVGDPLADDTKVGSLISRAHADKVRGLVEIGLEDGGELLAGGDLAARRRPGCRCLRGADRHRRRVERLADRPGGGVRPGRDPHPLQRRGRGGDVRERRPLRPGGNRLDRRWRARPSRGAEDSLRRGRHQHALRRLPRRPVRRLQGIRLRARAVARGARPVHRDEGRPAGHVAEAGESVRGLTSMSGALAAWYSRFPEGWWGYHWAPPTPMSAVELIGTPTIDARLMATLWAVVSRRRSVMLSSEAPQAGKTTALSALVDFLPDDTTGIFVRGWWEEYDWLDEIEPGTGYLLINEMSDHLPIYVWGRAARGALMLAGKGWGMGATMHADSLPEALELLRTDLGATDADLAGLTIYLQYSAYLTPTGMYRRVEEAWHLRLDDAGALAPVRLGAIEGDRSPSLTGAQRLPSPPMLPGDGGRSARPFVHDPAAYASWRQSLGAGRGRARDGA